jgi:2,3,4,5-tetrahydropyridine-2-carboxylate N-succinyltransferase
VTDAAPRSAFAAAFGIGRRNAAGAWLDAYFPAPCLAPSAGLFEALDAGLPADASELSLDPPLCAALAARLDAGGEPEQAALCRRLASADGALAVLLREDLAPATVPEAYLKLQLLSHRLLRPHGTVLDGLFAVLPNVAWTDEGPVDLAELPERQLAARCSGRTLRVLSVDKFPPMTDYVVPPGVRIADTARVRLGAYIGAGTTIMHEGFVNFNAGTAGPGMIEGRVSAGVFVGSDSDLGGGCSTMGTLSGGGNIVISIGENCLIGANAGVGIPLGDRCTVEAGLYLTAGMRVSLLDASGAVVAEVKARELAGESGLLFRRNSRSGAVECLSNRSAIELNAALHAHN